MEGEVRLLVDNAAAIDESGFDATTCSIWSTSTGLALKTGLDIKSPETFLTSEFLDSIARATSESANQIRTILTALEAENPEFRWISDTILVSILWFMRSLAVKALLLHRWKIADPEARSIVAGATKVSPVAGLSIDIGRHDNAFALLLMSDFLKDEDIQLVATKPVDGNLFYDTFNKVSLYDRALNILRRSTSALLYKAWDRFGRLPIGSGAAGQLFVLNEIATIEDSFVSVLRKGWRVQKLTLGSPSYRARALPSAAERTLAEIRETVTSVLRAPVGHKSYARAVSDILAQRLEVVLANYPSSLAHFESTAKQLLNSTCPAETIVLSNGLYSPENRLFSAVLRPTGIRTVCVDHGSAIGVPLYASQDLPNTYTFCDVFLNQNRKSSKLLNDAAPRPGFKAISIGANRDLLQPRAGRLGRHLARRRLSIKKEKRCAIYASTLESNNVHLGYGAGRDLDLLQVQSGVLEAASSFEGTFIVKPYPAQRYPDPSFLTSTPLHGDIVRSPHGELQNIRFAADLIIVDATASTLGVVLGAGCPVIFIKNKRARVAKGAFEEMTHSLFCVDADSANWIDELRKILRQPRDTLMDKWNHMEQRRLEFIDKRIASVHQVSSRAIPSALTELLQS